MFRKGLSETYASLWKSVVRPPRDVYTLEDLGPSRWLLAGKYRIERTDLRLKNKRGLTLECSHFVPLSGVFLSGCEPSKLACVVYLHHSQGSRLDVCREPIVGALLTKGMTVFAFDQSGSGLSGGEFVSVGHFEEKDLQVVLEHLRKSGRVGEIGLWGRSLGAITAINRLRRDPSITVAVIDSPFTNLRIVGDELAMGGVHIKIPRAIWSLVYEHIRKEIQSHVGIDAQTIIPIEHASKIRCPVMFGAATGDTVVLPYHAQEMHDAWGCEEGNKLLSFFDGDHWDDRPEWFYDDASDFLERHLVIKPMLLERKAAEEKARAEAEKATAEAEAAEKRMRAIVEARKKAEAKKKAEAERKRRVQQKAVAKAAATAKAQEQAELEARRQTELECMAREDAEGRRLIEIEAMTMEDDPKLIDEAARIQIEIEAMCREDAEALEREIELGQALAAAAVQAEADAQAAADFNASWRGRALLACSRAPARAEDADGDAPTSFEDAALVFDPVLGVPRWLKQAPETK